MSGFLLVSLLGGCASAHSNDQQIQNLEGREVIGKPLGGFPPNGFARNEDVGARFTNGQTVLFNTGETALEIVSVKPEIVGPSLRFLGARIAGLDREIGFAQYEATYPPQNTELGETQEAIGASLPPGPGAYERGYELLLGFEVVGTERSTVRSLEVRYLDEGKERKLRLTATMAICTPADAVDECPQEYGDAS